MANAKRCDKCGEFFDPFYMDGYCCRFVNPMFKTENDIREGLLGKPLVDGSPDMYIDLCPHCARLFKVFMDRSCSPEWDGWSEAEIEKAENRELYRQIDELKKENDRLKEIDEKMRKMMLRLQSENLLLNEKLVLLRQNRDEGVIWDIFKENGQNEKEKIESFASDLLHRILHVLGLGDLVHGDSGGTDGNRDISCDSERAERKSGTDEEGDG